MMVLTGLLLRARRLGDALIAFVSSGGDTAARPNADVAGAGGNVRSASCALATRASAAARVSAT